MLRIGDSMEAKLEERVSTADVRVGGNIDNAVNAEYVFYSGPTPPSDNGGGLNGTNNYDPLGTHSNFGPGSQNNIRRDIYSNDELIITERFDFGETGKDPHYNLDYRPSENSDKKI